MERLTPRTIIHSERCINKAETLLILSHVLSKPKEEILKRMDETIGPEKLYELKIRLEERRKGKPLSYITGKKEFFSLEFFVNSATLIPRPETEILVEEALRILRDGRIKKVLDLGTGCGAIGITLAKLTGVKVLCVDISKDALDVAKKNSIHHGVSERIDLLCSDLLSSVKGKFDLVLANLPYVSDEEYEKLPKDVKDYEPRIALYGGKEGLEVIMRFLEDVDSFLSESSYLLIEVGGKRQSRIVSQFLKEKGFSVSSMSDYSGRERVVKAGWRSS